jgi:hypothetical protein
VKYSVTVVTVVVSVLMMILPGSYSGAR